MDKLVHFGIHFILVFCWLVYYTKSSSSFQLRNILYIALICVIYGILIEVLQGVTKTRGSELADVYANITGTALGVLVFLILKTKFKRKA